MSTFKPLKTLTSRRQMLKAGLAALTLSGMSRAIAKDETPLKTTTGHSKPKAKKAGARRIVMLDPGHGGIDTGAIGHNGSKEKHVVLAIAKNVRAQLRAQGIDARLTRTGDTFIPLYDRVEIAHQHGADLFMSIHADGFTNPSAAGASVFALSNRGASSAMAKYLSDKENAADEVAGKKATDKDHLLQQVLFDLVQTDTIKNSLTLGSHILKQIKPVHRLHSRNTEQAAFVVLKSPSIPSVLVETSFITNPAEEKLLGTTAFRQKIATAIADGILNYFSWFDNHKAHVKRRG
ncbi:MAG: N-acetylmuramoyl-L-alanine amidase [Proteobacteria bacterium]|uniref:N-acetylmuramoyl-L-alanine amidase AmiA n=1 Tax=Kosakonia oryziphila TaxID=1005667 RepID=A0A1C4E591_9ENTR|nr:N-acetylmuramoyl-L-alanine amidase AmiA [Kosakonia oryziphila]MBS1203308.1 N-acetylmuramoyl-L-alanine amidase [Pseudomonadota bacterium]SCC38675.1 N-acetylmuramoyl-L-alanine amidase [Kosakonia oryziphila]